MATRLIENDRGTVPEVAPILLEARGRAECVEADEAVGREAGRGDKDVARGRGLPVQTYRSVAGDPDEARGI